VLGGIADYSGATVLELPLACGVVALAQRARDGLLAVRTGGPAAPPLPRNHVSLPLGVLVDGDAATAPERLRTALAAADAPWAAYVLGPLAVLQAAGEIAGRLAGQKGPEGLKLAIWSTVPAGAGVSSSAALEVAALRALQALYGLDLDPLRVAELAQQAEHRVASAPCGIMDQATAALGRRDQVLLLRCQPCEVLGYLPLPRDVRLYGIDSGVAHRVAGSQYGRVRAAAFMGRAILRALSEADTAPNPPDPPDPLGGYLCNLSPARFADVYASRVPAKMRGDAFLAHYGKHGDPVTTVEPDIIYSVRDCTAHPIFEQANVETFLAALGRYDETGDPEALAAAGAAMYRSHASYGERCGLGTPETDLLVELARERGPDAGIYGAKITGGGAGGTVALLAAGPDAERAVESIAAAYTAQTGHFARVLAGSSDGACWTPVRTVNRDTPAR
jgi:L-arabinokinase